MPLLRLSVDPAALEPNPAYYQYTRGLWNITSPTAGEGVHGGPRLRAAPAHISCSPACPLGIPSPAAHPPARPPNRPPAAGGPGGPPGKAGPPIFLSRPHYCGADPSLAAGVVGLRCDPARHSTHIDVGAWVSAAATLRLREGAALVGQQLCRVAARVLCAFMPNTREKHAPLLHAARSTPLPAARPPHPLPSPQSPPPASRWAPPCACR